MTRVIGTKSVDYWENEVFKALKNQLPNDWVILPNVKWTLSKNGYVRDGEADFVVLAPGLGLVIVEVKGSKEFMVSEDGKWNRLQDNGTWIPLKEAPPEQAMRNMHDLISILNENNKWYEFPGLFSYLVIYPQGEARSLPPMFDESTISTRRHMNQLTSRIRNSLDKRGGSSRATQFTPQIIETVIDHLKNRKFHVFKVDTGEDVANDIGTIEQLTRQQFSTLRGLFQLPNIAVIGPAGSGKTILALWRLQALVDEGLNPIYVCYNRTLADSLRLRHPKYSKYIWNIDRLFLELCPEQKSSARQDNFYREALPGVIMDHAKSLTRYDAILVDEGQDFSELQIIALLELRAAESSWAFFADWNQDVYGAGYGKPIGADVIFHLHHNCRNTIKINDASNNYLTRKVESMPGMPIGVPPIIESTGNQAKRAWELAKQWSGEGSIAILSPYKLENSSMKDQINGHGLYLSTDINELGKVNRVFFSTIKSFKGIEAAVVIVVDVAIPDISVAFTSEDLYVACTRATTRLALISSKKDVASYFNNLSTFSI